MPEKTNNGIFRRYMCKCIEIKYTQNKVLPAGKLQVSHNKPDFQFQESTDFKSLSFFISLKSHTKTKCKKKQFIIHVLTNSF